MNDQLRESLSALMDDEANELELERILANAGKNEELRQTWSRYNVSRQAAAGQEVACAGLDVSRQVQAAIANAGIAEAAPETRSAPLGERILKPIASFGVAASVAFAVVLGGQQLAVVGAGETDQAPTVAASPSAVGMVNSLGATTVQASLGTAPLPTPRISTRISYEDLARQRMDLFMQEHAEHAALNTPHGMVPFARIPRIEE